MNLYILFRTEWREIVHREDKKHTLYDLIGHTKEYTP